MPLKKVADKFFEKKLFLLPDAFFALHPDAASGGDLLAHLRRVLALHLRERTVLAGRRIQAGRPNAQTPAACPVIRTSQPRQAALRTEKSAVTVWFVNAAPSGDRSQV